MTELAAKINRDRLTLLYGAGNEEAAISRLERLAAGFRDAFGREPEAIFSAPGRTEIGGNHTDHQHGRVLAASVDLDVVAAVARIEEPVVRFKSEGYPTSVVELNDLAAKKDEEGKTPSLIRGIADAFSKRGCVFDGGFEAYAVSDVPGGSGLSSSAAFEILVGTIVNGLYFGDKCTPVEVAQIGQYAENVYFGKPSGLLDQMASSIGSVVTIDFADNSAPVVERVELDLAKYGYALCIIDSGADHADLTDEYAAVTKELRAVCDHFRKTVLREVPEEDFYAALPELRKEAGDRAVLRAMHVYNDNKRVIAQVKALREGDFDTFLAAVSDSGSSSWRLLQNVVPAGYTEHQEVAVALAVCERLLAGRGAFRVHGGGFAGTVQAFVPLDMLDTFKAGIEAALSKGCCRALSIRPAGGYRIV